MTEITFSVEHCDDTGILVASWDEPNGTGGITTQGHDLSELQQMVKDAVLCHFNEGKAPAAIRFHFVNDPVLAIRRSSREMFRARRHSQNPSSPRICCDKATRLAHPYDPGTPPRHYHPRGVYGRSVISRGNQV